MSNLTAEPGELRLTIEVKRAATGETETFDLVGHIVAKEEAQQALEKKEEKWQ